MFILSWGRFCNILNLYQCIEYWINFQKMYTFTYKIYTFTYKKDINSWTFLLVFKIVKSLQYILNAKAILRLNLFSFSFPWLPVIVALALPYNFYQILRTIDLLHQNHFKFFSSIHIFYSPLYLCQL